MPKVKDPFKGWLKKQQIRGWFALNKRGQPVASNSRAACKWCALGRLFKYHISGTEFEKFLHTEYKADIAVLNDIVKWTPSDFRRAWREFQKSINVK